MPPPAPWYCPSIRGANPAKNEPSCGAGTHAVDGSSPEALRKVFHLTLGGRRIEVQPFPSFFRGFLLALGFLALWSIFPRPLMERGNYLFDPIATFVVPSVVGGAVCHFFRLPGLVGILLAAVVWGNLGGHYFIEGIVPEIRQISSRIGLTVIVSRAGFAVNIKEVKKLWKNALSLSLVPMIGEAVVHAVVAKQLLDLPDYRWAFMQGFVVSGIAPGVVVPPLLGLREEGFGHTGPTSLMLSSVVLDSVISIWATSFFIDLVFSSSSVGLAIALGPIQLVVGALIGFLLAFVLHFVVKVFLAEAAPVECEDDAASLSLLKPTAGSAGLGTTGYYSRSTLGKLFASDSTLLLPKLKYTPAHLEQLHYKVVVLYSAIALSLVFVGARVNLAGGGAIGVLTFAATLAHIWVPPAPAVPASSPPAPTSSAAPIVVATEGKKEEEGNEAVENPINGRKKSPSPTPSSDPGGVTGSPEPPKEDDPAIPAQSGTFEVQKDEVEMKEQAPAPNVVAPSNEPVPNPEKETDDKASDEDKQLANKRCDSVSLIDTPPTQVSEADERKEYEEAHGKRLQAVETAFYPAQRLKLFVEYAFIWDNLAMPFLFTMGGSKVSLYETFDGDFFPSALACLAAGVGTRFLLALICSLGQGFSAKELVFVGLGWIGKAAVQAALGGVALNKALKEEPVDIEKITAGQTVERVAYLSAILMAPISACFVVVLGRRWLPKKEMA